MYFKTVWRGDNVTQDYEHTQSDLKKLVDQLEDFEEEIHVTMEATGNYHFPIAAYAMAG